MSVYKIRHYILLVLLSLWTIALTGQEHPDSLLENGKILEGGQQFDEAYDQYAKASAGYESMQDHIGFVAARVRMAEVTQFAREISRAQVAKILEPVKNLIAEGQIEKYAPEVASYYTIMGQYYRTITGNYPEALQMFDQGLEICDSLGDSTDPQRIKIQVERSQLLANQENFDQALSSAQEALDLSIKTMGENHPLVGPRYYNLGFIYYRKGHFDRAEELIKEGIRILRENGGPEMQVALGYNNLSAIYVAQMDLKEATENAVRFRNIVENYLGPDHEAIGMVHWDLGQLRLNVEEYQAAIGDLQRAINIFESRFGPEYQQLPDLYHQLGSAYSGAGDCLQGEENHLEGLQLKEKIFSSAPAKIIESYRYLGQHYLDCGDLPKSKEFVDLALEIARDALDPTALSYAWLYDLLGDYYIANDSFMAGALAQQKALFVLAEDNASHPLEINPPLDSLYNLIQAAESATAKSTALIKCWEIDLKVDVLEAAQTAVLFTDKIIDQLRSDYRSSESKTFLQQRARDHYENMLALAIAKKDMEGQDQMELAWRAMEKSRSLLLMEALKDQNVPLDLPDTLASSYRELQDDLGYLESSILAAREMQDSVGLTNYQLMYTQVRDQFLQLSQQIEDEFSNYYELTRQIEPVALNQLQSTLTENELTIQFFWGKNSLYRLVAGYNRFEFDQLEIPDGFSAQIDQWIDQQQDLSSILAEPDQAIDKFDRLSHAIYQILFQDLEFNQVENHLIIVPDQTLAYISFEALCSDPDQSLTFDKYLIGRFDITYAYSGSHHFQLKSAPTVQNKSNFAGFAPSYEAEPDTTEVQDLLVSRLYRAGEANLPGAKKEVEDIQSIMGGDIWLDQQATETAFKENIGEYDVAHLSLHGLINDDQPLYSKLVFNSRDSVNDGYLNAYEIYQLPINANLIVLSACNTGLGKLEKGEGVMSLSRTFAYAGCPQLIASLWKADDQSTSEIMTGLYTELSRKLSVTQALRQAKQKFLENQKVRAFHHPYFWAAFVPYGQSPPQVSSFPILPVIFGIIIVVLIVWIIRVKA